MICDPQMLVDGQGRELCFEELRAEHMCRQAPCPTAAEPDSLAMGHSVVSANAMPDAAAVTPAMISNNNDQATAPATISDRNDQAATPATISDDNDQAAAPITPQANAAGCQAGSAAPPPSPQQQQSQLATEISPVREAVGACNAENEVPDENAVPLAATDPEAPRGGEKSQPSVGQNEEPRTVMGLRSFAAPAASEPLQQPRAILAQVGGSSMSSSMPSSPGACLSSPEALLSSPGALLCSPMIFRRYEYNTL